MNELITKVYSPIFLIFCFEVQRRQLNVHLKSTFFYKKMSRHIVNYTFLEFIRACRLDARMQDVGCHHAAM